MLVERDPYVVLQVGRFDAWPDIRAAYRAQVRRFHADGLTPDRDRMVEINAAYECLEREHNRARDGASHVGSASAGVPAGPGHPQARVTPSDGSLLGRMTSARRLGLDTPTVDFGQYAGWSIAEIAECDPRYLRWLSRHSSGFRYRAIIERVLGSDPDIGRRAALLR